MTQLGRLIREIQRDAAALPTDALRTEIGVSLEVMDAAIGQFHNIRPGAGNLRELIDASSEVMLAVLTTALYVRELTSRPAEHRIARVHLSLN